MGPDFVLLTRLGRSRQTATPSTTAIPMNRTPTPLTNEKRSMLFPSGWTCCEREPNQPRVDATQLPICACRVLHTRRVNPNADPLAGDRSRLCHQRPGCTVRTGSATASWRPLGERNEHTTCHTRQDTAGKKEVARGKPPPCWDCVVQMGRCAAMPGGRWGEVFSQFRDALCNDCAKRDLRP